jgi:hypothetical protein
LKPVSRPTFLFITIQLITSNEFSPYHNFAPQKKARLLQPGLRIKVAGEKPALRIYSDKDASPHGMELCL